MRAGVMCLVAVFACLGTGVIDAAAGTATRVAVGTYHSCALTAAGGVKCWGHNNNGQLGDGTWTTSRATPGDVAGLTSGVVAVAAGGDHTCAVTSTGAVKCWGENDFGELGDGTTTARNTPVNVSGLTSGVVAVAAAGSYTCAVTSTGGVKCWGYNRHGQLGDGTTIDRSTPVDASGLTSGVVAVAAGGATCAVTSAGGLKCWGYNNAGQVGDGTTTNRMWPVNVTGLTSGVAAVAAGGLHSCAVTSSADLKCWGSNYSGQLGDGTTTDRMTPVDVLGLAAGVAGVAAGTSDTCVVTTAGGVKCWGSNFAGQLGDGTRTDRITPGDVSGLTSGVVAVAAGGTHNCAVTDAGRVKCWGDNRYGQLGDATLTYRVEPHDVTGLESGVGAVAPGGQHSCALTTGGGVKCWGMNTAGQLGHPFADPWESLPQDVTGLTSGVMAVVTGSEHSCALTTGGGVKCWGSNTSSQLGCGYPCHNATWLSTPVDVVDLSTGVVALSAGGNHTCALTAGGGLKCWGSNSRGQIGDGGSMVGSRSTPVDVTGLTSGVVAVSAGGSHTCTVTTGGGVKCWGSNSDGQVGAWGPYFTTPVDVIGLASGIQALDAGGTHTCALTSAGGAKCWGNNQYGALGDGTTTDRTPPSDVTGLTSGVAAIAAGGGQTCALTSGGAAKCWGHNSYGQAGDGTTASRSTPVDVSGLTSGVMAVAAGSAHTCAVTSAGGVKCWGDDAYGKLGNGRWLRRARPYPVKGFGPPVTFADFSGDGQADYAVFQPSTGTWLVRNVGNWTFGAQGDMPVAGDYDGDGQTEEALYRPGTGMWTVRKVALDTTSARWVCGTGDDLCDQSHAAAGQVQFGASGDVPVPADYDADGRTDIAVFRPSSGTWFVRGGATIVWGGPADIPVPADYDGDGRAELGLFQPSSGTWFVRDVGTWAFGMAGDVPVPADYDGDGAADAAVFRPSNATWYVRDQGSWPFGSPGDVPMPLDLDADGRVELVVYRPSSGTWYSLAPATGAQTTVAFGSPGDVPALTRPLGAPRTKPHDFTGDLKSDILWRHVTGGDVWLWPMDGAAKLSETYVRTVADTTWEIRGQGDMNGDGTADLLWRNKTTGMIYWWPMNAGAPTAELYVATVDPAYDIVGTGDFNGDGKADILWRNTLNGEVWIWRMDGATPTAEAFIDRVDVGYVVKGVGDLDGDGDADIVWHGAAGDVWVWLMNGTARLSQTYVGTVADTNYQIQQVADFDGNGKADLLWWNTSRGEVWIWPMNGGTRLAESYVGTVPDTNYRVQAAGDYNGDTKADILWRNIVQGDVWVWLMDGTTKLSETWVATVPDAGYQIVK